MIFLTACQEPPDTTDGLKHARRNPVTVLAFNGLQTLVTERTPQTSSL